MKRILIFFLLMMTVLLSACSNHKNNQHVQTNEVQKISIGETYEVLPKANYHYYKLINSSEFVYVEDHAVENEMHYLESNTAPHIVYLFGEYTINHGKIILMGATSGIDVFLNSSDKVPRKKAVSSKVLDKDYAKRAIFAHAELVKKNNKYSIKYKNNSESVFRSIRQKKMNLPNNVGEVKKLYQINN